MDITLQKLIMTCPNLPGQNKEGKRMLRFFMKLLAIPVYLVLCVLCLLADLLMRLYSFGVGIIGLFLVLFVVLAMIWRQWYNVGAFVVMLVLIAGFTFAIGLFAATIEIWRDRLKGFIEA